MLLLVRILFFSPCTLFWSKRLWTVQNLLFFGHSLCWWKSIVSTLIIPPGLQGLLLNDWTVNRMNCNLEGERFTILESIQNATNLRKLFSKTFFFYHLWSIVICGCILPDWLLWGRGSLRCCNIRSLWLYVVIETHLDLELPSEVTLNLDEEDHFFQCEHPGNDLHHVNCSPVNTGRLPGNPSEPLS